MKKTTMLFVFVLPLLFTNLVSGASAAASHAKAASADDLSRQVKQTMEAFAAMDVATFEAALAEDVLGYEVDLDNKPIRLNGRKEAMAFALDTFAGLKKMGARATIHIRSISCNGYEAIGYCTVDFEFRAKMSDGTSMVQASRNTIVLVRSGHGWKWQHWHSSPAASQPSGK